MGRTLPSAAQVFQMEEKNLSAFRRFLRPTDRHILDLLLDMAQKHVAEAAYAAHPLPMHIFLLSILMEQHKEVMSLREQVAQVQARMNVSIPEDEDPGPDEP